MKKLISVFICLLLVIPSRAGTIYVDVNATGANDGSNWADAYKYLQDAFTAAGSGTDIRVAQGTYKPDVNTGNPAGTNDRTATFRLKVGVALYGGYPHGGGSRDPNIYATSLSGDIGAADNNSDNSYHVITSSSVDSTAILDGFTIAVGNAAGSLTSQKMGGGMYNSSSSPTITNCTFTSNLAAWGGGMYNSSGSPTVTDCIFASNTATLYAGGGMLNSSSSPTITNCIFTGNSAAMNSYGGGGIFNDNSSSAITNCVFAGNSASSGGGMFNSDSSGLAVINCTFTGNSAANNGGGVANRYCDPTLTNCILWGNTATDGSQIYEFYSTTTVNFSDVQGGWTGTGNIDADPCFVAGLGGNYYLSQIASGQAGNSPCVDAGSDTAENLGMDIFTTRTDSIGDAGIVDMGYHYPPLFPNPDLNGDSFIDFIDYAILANQWMLRKLSFDIAPGSGDGIVNFHDYAIFANGWLNVNDMHDLEDFTSQWLLRGAYNADIAPPHGDGLVDFSDLAVLCDNWLETF